jgi:RNA polymerase sigma-70 factor (ECF subfamily)
VNRLYAYAMRCLHDSMAAEDIVAETFERAMEYLPRFEWRGPPFRAWLYRIASSAIAGRARRVATVGLEAAPEPADDALSPEEALLRGERDRALMLVVATLPLLQRQVVLLRYGEDLSLRDIALALGRSEGAVKALLHRAQRTLQRRLVPGGLP